MTGVSSSMVEAEGGGELVCGRNGDGGGGGRDREGGGNEGGGREGGVTSESIPMT